jgi:hypothetical protein
VLDLTVYDPTTGDVALTVEGFRFMALPPQPPASGLYEVEWEEAPLGAARAGSPAFAAVSGTVSLVQLPQCACSSSLGLGCRRKRKW